MQEVLLDSVQFLPMLPGHSASQKVFHSTAYFSHYSKIQILGGKCVLINLKLDKERNHSINIKTYLCY